MAIDDVDSGESWAGVRASSLSTMVPRDARFYSDSDSLEEIMPYELLSIVLIMYGVQSTCVSTTSLSTA